MSNYNKVKVIKGWSEYNISHYIPGLHFVFFLDERSGSCQHIVKNQDDPDYFSIERSNGTIETKLSEG